MKNTTFLRLGALLLLGFGAGTPNARAQGGMPDLSDFSGAIAAKVESAPKKLAPTPKGGFASGLTVPRVKPGEGARAIGRNLRMETEKAAAGQPEMLKMIPALLELEKAMPAMLTGVEKEFVKQGLAPRDIGTAYAFTFMVLHENATGQTTTDAQDKVATRTLSSVFGTYFGPKWKKMTPAAKETMYETMVMATTLNALLIQQFKQAGKTDDVTTLQQGAADLFEKLFGVPAAQVKIAANGRISGMREEAEAEPEN